MSFEAILLFIGVLLVLVIIHELGHFVAAKLVGMRVDEFAFGFPPRLFAKKYGETTYAFNAIPLGGYVSILGENGGDDEKKKEEANKNPRAFGNKSVPAQLVVLLAGVCMNMVLALILFIAISFGDVRISVTDTEYGERVTDPKLVVVEVSKDSPAFKAGIVPGSTITNINSLSAQSDLTSATSVISFLEKHQNKPITIAYISPEGESRETTVALVYGIVENKKALGVALDVIGTVQLTTWEAIMVGIERTYNTTEMVILGFGDLLSSLFKGDNVIDSLSGPVGIAKIVDQTSNYGYTALLTLIAVLSINLAIFNALPLPALDGGRVIVVLLETAFRRKIPFTYYAWINSVGFLLLLFLLIIVTINDIQT